MIISYILITLLVLSDYILKIIFSSIYEVNQVEVILENVLKFGYIQNTGAAFGMFEGQQLLFFFITIIALIAFGYFFSKSDLKNKKIYTLGLVFLISGTLGNAIDRLFYGFVIDYIQVPFIPFAGSTFFNLADALLCVGVAFIIIDILILDTIKEKKLKQSQVEENDKN